jgi:hypothetical protein
MTEPLSIEEAQILTQEFLIGQMVPGLRAVDYEQPPLDTEPFGQPLADLSRAEILFRHVPGSSDATFLVRAFGDELLMTIQLNVRRFVVVYQIPVQEPVDANAIEPHFARWQIGAAHAGWQIGWRDAVDPWRRRNRYVEVYAYAMLSPDFLTNEAEQLYWRTDIMQMTRAFILEARRCTVPLSPGRVGYEV